MMARRVMAGRGGFSPKALFAAGEQGVWYDPSDLTTLFQDAAGTIPVTAVEQPVGLMLDKSKGLVLGTERVTNGDFSNGTTGWTAGKGASIARSTAVFPDGGLLVTAKGGAGSYGIQDVNGLTAGKRYVLSARVYSPSTNAANNCATIGIQSSSFTSAGSIAQLATDQIQTISIQFIASGTSQTIYCSVVTPDFLGWGADGSVAHFDNISVRELPGNHAYQTTSANRPTLSARYNLLERTEDISNGYWVKNNLTASGADTLLETAANNVHWIARAIVAGGASTFSFDVQGVGRSFVFIRSGLGLISLGVNTSVINLDTATVQANGTECPVLSIVALADGWTRVVCSRSTDININVGPLLNATTHSYLGDATKGIKVRKLDLRVANDGIGLPSYQRVNTSTDYDTVGFPLYLRFNGSTQFLQTNSIDFTSTDKVLVAAGVQKLSDSTAATVAELSANSGVTPNTFAVFAPGAVAPNYTFRSSGTSDSVATATTFASPITNVLVGLGEVASDTAILRINGAQAAQSTADQGTGNYGNYPLYIGARGGSSLYFNGHLYSLIVRGAQTPANLIAATERYVARKTGVTF